MSTESSSSWNFFSCNLRSLAATRFSARIFFSSSLEGALSDGLLDCFVSDSGLTFLAGAIFVTRTRVGVAADGEIEATEVAGEDGLCGDGENVGLLFWRKVVSTEAVTVDLSLIDKDGLRASRRSN